jgi:hypothetical protein
LRVGDRLGRMVCRPDDLQGNVLFHVCGNGNAGRNLIGVFSLTILTSLKGADRYQRSTKISPLHAGDGPHTN